MFRKKEDGAIDMVSLILTVVIAGITLMVGIMIVSNMEITVGNSLSAVDGNISNASPSIDGPVRTVRFGASRMSGSFSSILTNAGTAFNFLALGLFILAAVFIIGIVAGVLGKE
jgi:hypothetical protein